MKLKAMIRLLLILGVSFSGSNLLSRDTCNWKVWYVDEYSYYPGGKEANPTEEQVARHYMTEGHKNPKVCEPTCSPETYYKIRQDVFNAKIRAKDHYDSAGKNEHMCYPVGQDNKPFPAGPEVWKKALIGNQKNWDNERSIQGDCNYTCSTNRLSYTGTYNKNAKQCLCQ